MSQTRKRKPINVERLVYNTTYLCEIEHWSEEVTKVHTVYLTYVDEDDCCWRFKDGSELSYDWDVVVADGMYEKF